ncbi:Zinc finger protein [Thalictrum thalictroides]|uniref:Zinc finger protein n=1 Tax=Thalictrum thalictroides TaxID=46969 RepID=A0A7J6W014_THATH|nr:Zinc finger protein [Thalictrum thalictroides]
MAERIPCDYCGEEKAVLFCRADSAKLCLLCDLHVHSANDLSKKHLRSQICDNCNSEPVSIRCSTDNLVLCQECDWDAHGNCSVSASHERNPVEGFSGCPSAIELASIWGFDLGEKNNSSVSLLTSIQEDSNSVFSNWSSLDSILYMDSWISSNSIENNNLQELMAKEENPPNGNSSSLLYPNVPCAEIPQASSKRGQNPSCGKHKQLILKQLLQLFKRDLNQDAEDLSPGTPTQQVNAEGIDLQKGVGVGQLMDANQIMQQQLPYTSLLMSSVETDLKGTVRLLEDHHLWGCNPPSSESSQIWDFNLGRSRDHEAPNQLEDGYGTTSKGFMIQTYTDFTKKAPPETTKVLEDVYGINCSTTGHHMKSDYNTSKKSASSRKTHTSESNNLNLPGADISCIEQPLLLRGENARTTTKVDMELLAQNRGNAMLRYKMKKRTRRFDKHIRYESRKARADTRKRVKGRFVKASETPDVDASR